VPGYGARQENNKQMRSDLIYGALGTVGNRYTLCQLVSKATRKPNTRVQETMNDVLVRFSRVHNQERVMARPPQKFVAEFERQAA
jgi:hypothetical protein